MSLNHALLARAQQRIQEAKRAAGVTPKRHKEANPCATSSVTYEVLDDAEDITRILFHTKALPKGRPRLCIDREKLRVAVMNRDMALAISAFTVITPKKTALYENALRVIFSQVMLLRHRDVCEADIGVSVVMAHRNAVYGDLDNQQKAILDAMNGIIFKDDKLVSELHAKRIAAQEDSFTVAIHWPSRGACA